MTHAVTSSAGSAERVSAVVRSEVSNSLPSQRKRDFSIDAFRFVSLLCIFFSHSSYPKKDYGFISIFIGFDVALLNAGCALGSKQSLTKRSYWPYLWKKIKGICIPPYVYLFCVWVVNLFLPMPFSTPMFFRLHIRLYGYLWTIRGYVLIYAMSPLINAYCGRQKSHVHYFFSIGLVSVLLPVVFNTIQALLSSVPRLENLFYYNLGLIFLFPMMHAYFLRVPELTYTQFWRLFVTLMGITISIMLTLQWKGKNIHPCAYRLPVSILFCTYGLSAAMISYRLTPLYEYIFSFLGIKPIVSFVSSHSMWVNLHHITFKLMAKDEASILQKWFMISATSICFTYLQSRIVEKIASRVRPSVATNLRLILG